MPFFIIKVAILIALMNSMGVFSGHQTLPMPMHTEVVSPYAVSTVEVGIERIEGATRKPLSRDCP